MAPFTESHQARWQAEAKRAFGAALPDWTIADDSDNEYDVHIYKKRTSRSRVRRDGRKLAPGEPTVKISVLRTPGTKRSDDESDSDSEKSEREEREERNGNADEVKLELPASNAPSVAAPSAEGSVSDSGQMVSGGDGIHSNVHKILLGVGSVGAFLLLLGIGFVAWKFYTKRTAKKKSVTVDDMSFDKPSRFENLVSKVPYLGSRFGHKGWYTIEDPSQVTVEKTQPVPSPAAPTIQRPNSHLTVPNTPKTPKTPLGVYRMGSTRTARSWLDTDAVSPTSTMFVEDTAVQVQVVARHDPKESLSSTYKPQHKRVPSTTPHAYDLGRRQTGFSELSSISSGFGDGDIVVTPTYQTVQSVPLRPAPSRQTTWKSSSSLTRRDTASTVASLDVRPRFHSVNSWVKQQNGHLRRAQRQQESSSDSDTPPVPVLPPPPEQDFRYMLPDDERPRPVEMV
ncbi:hypothetical protein NW762_007321 [Fusarium torreyae]|uniref:Uncharacterized protein n=1 Tax=Fusarium torreyae TaxID=1237075 RepID=A0A9W8RZC7_9HYPO|nr:hypothetical protein NW762_007321 [Fusarium torreyae]